MNFIQHQECNGVLGAPPGISIERVRPLPVKRALYEDGTPTIISYWKPSEEDLKILNSGGCVALNVLGQTMYPVFMECVK